MLSPLTYTSWAYFALVIMTLIAYYALPKRAQWCVLLAGSVVFYVLASGRDWKCIAVFVASVVSGYLFGLALGRWRKLPLLVVAVAVSILPFILTKGDVFLFKRLPGGGLNSLIVPLGLSFYSLQLYAYLYDIYRGKIEAQRNPMKHLLFMSYFPQIVQGPIPRYGELGPQLFAPHGTKGGHVSRGAQLTVWGFFLKYMIAERAGVIVDAVFAHGEMYLGMYALVAGILYSIQLYTDFLGCVCMCRGVSEMFGIELADNFQRPYFAHSIRDFWRRWHISLSSWLRDYVYIPLGGSRHGKLRKYLNLIVTFVASGIWHGNGYRFVIWGLMHAVYQIVGELTAPLRARAKRLLKVPGGGVY